MEENPTYAELEQQVATLQELALLQKQWEDAFKESEERFKTQYQNIPLPTSSWQKQGDDFVLIRLNHAAEILLRGQSHDWVGRTARDLFRGRPEIIDSFHYCYDTKTMLQQELSHTTRDGNTKYFMVNQVILPPDLVLMYLEDISERKEAQITLQKSHDRLEREVAKRTLELRQANAELQQDIAERKRAEEALRQSEAKFRALAESTSTAIFIYQDKRFTYVNPAWEILTGYSRMEASRMHIREIVHPEMHDLAKIPGNPHAEAAYSHSYEVKLLSKQAKIKWVDYVSTPIEYERRPAMLGSCFDITIRKATETALREKERELEEQARHLAEMNTALKILLEYREEEKKKMEKQIVSHVKKLIFPYLDKMEKMGLSSDVKIYLSIIRANLKDFISPFAYALSSQHLSLTPTEIQIADLIKQGRSSKEIAGLMNVSADAVTFHRANIRRKLEIAGKKINLRTYLQSLSQ